MNQIINYFWKLISLLTFGKFKQPEKSNINNTNNLENTNLNIVKVKIRYIKEKEN